MPIDPKDEERMLRAMARMLDERLGPVVKRVERHSGQQRALEPTVYGIRDSQVGLEDRALGFERLMLDSMALQAQRQEETAARVESMARSIPPAADAAKGAELAAVAGAQAAVRAEGKTDAIQVAANRADTHSLASKVAANRTLIAQIVAAAALAAWQIYEHFAGVKP